MTTNKCSNDNREDVDHNILLINARSIMNKIDELQCIISNETNLNFICLTETWLKPEIPDFAINIDGYICYRSDRNDRKGGGVCMYVKENFVVRQWNMVNKPISIEALVLQILMPLKLVICVVYIPPQITQDSAISDCIIDTFDQILANNYNYNIILAGDFNKFDMTDIISNLSLTATVTEATRNEAILDQIFTDINTSTLRTQVLGSLASSDHNIVKFTFTYDYAFHFKDHEFVFDFRASNLNKVKNFLKDTSWNQIFLKDDIDEKCHEFYMIVYSALCLLPCKKIKKSSKDKSWITPLLKSLINDRWNAFRSKDFVKYNHLKQKIKNAIVSCKQKWAKNCLQDNKNVWNLVTTRGKTYRSLDATSFHDADSSDNTEVADHINTNLLSHCPQSKTASIINATVPEMPITFSVHEIYDKLSTLKMNKAGGSDKLNSKILTTFATELSEPICHIFNNIIKSMKWPQAWKTGLIIPVPKSNPPSINNVRPISLLPILSKIFESLLLNRIKPLLLQNISSNQFGFVPFSSTEATIISIIDDATILLDRNDVFAVSFISYDLQKAFDHVNHNKLCNKLSHVVPANICQLLIDYLTDRSQQVKLGNAVSRKLRVYSGVPQGGVLSPYLFNVFLDDLTAPSNSTIYKYADDTTFLTAHFNNNLEADFKTVENHMNQWCETNKMTINKRKTQIMTISKKNARNMIYGDFAPASKKEMKILGVTINNQLRFDSHIDYIVRKCSQRIYLLRQLKLFTPQHHLRVVYIGLIHSLIMYASASFVNLPRKLEQKLHRVQKRAHTVVCYKGCDCCKLPSPNKSRLIHAKKLFVTAEANPNHRLNSKIPHRLPRTDKYTQPHANTSRRLNSFIPFVTLSLNSA